MSKRRFTYIGHTGDLGTFRFKDARRLSLCFLEITWWRREAMFGPVYATIPGSTYEIATDVKLRNLVRLIPQEELARLMAGSIRNRGADNA